MQRPMAARLSKLGVQRGLATQTTAPVNLVGQWPEKQAARPNPFSVVHDYLAQFDEPPSTIKAPLIDLNSNKIASTSQIALPAAVFAHACHPSLFHFLVRQHLAGLRQGTHSNLSRHEVSYSNKKVRQQKGTGKSRLGDRGSPMLRGGGRAFAKKPKDYSFPVPKKMVAKGICGALSVRLAMGELSLINGPSLTWEDDEIGKTRYLKQIMRHKGWLAEKDRGTMFILGQSTLASTDGQALERAARNLPAAIISDAIVSLNVYELLRPSRLVLDLAAVEEIVDQVAPLTILAGSAEVLDEETMESELQHTESLAR